MTNKAPKLDHVGGIAGEALRNIVERAERLRDERDAIGEDLKELFASAKGQGFDLPAIKAILSERRKDSDAVAEHNTIVDLYKAALGMLPNFESEEDPSKDLDIADQEMHGRVHVYLREDEAFDPVTGEITEQNTQGDLVRPARPPALDENGKAVGTQSVARPNPETTPEETAHSGQAGRHAGAPDHRSEVEAERGDTHADVGPTCGRSAVNTIGTAADAAPVGRSVPAGQSAGNAGQASPDTSPPLSVSGEAPITPEGATEAEAAPGRFGETSNRERDAVGTAAKDPAEGEQLQHEGRIPGSGECITPEEGDAQSEGNQPETGADLGVGGDFLSSSSCGTTDGRGAKLVSEAGKAPCGAGVPIRQGSPVVVTVSAVEATHLGVTDHTADAERPGPQEATEVGRAGAPAVEVARLARLPSDTAEEPQGTRSFTPADPYPAPTMPEVMSGDPSPAELQIARKLGVKAFDEDIKMETIPVPDFRHPMIVAHWKAGLKQAHYDHVEGGGKYWGNKSHRDYIETIDGEPIEPVSAPVSAPNAPAAAPVAALPVEPAPSRMLRSTAPQPVLVMPARKTLTPGEPVPKQRKAMSKAELAEDVKRKNAARLALIAERKAAKPPRAKKNPKPTETTHA